MHLVQTYNGLDYLNPVIELLTLHIQPFISISAFVQLVNLSMGNSTKLKSYDLCWMKTFSPYIHNNHIQTRTVTNA
ncbi:hypothetical protein L6452_07524 [Arctium lappa]|uniref:Uncharacterized protein n=1 Tax=Arctium lappa TaxID=4217 RepID=A0ACB9EKZ8_ARCLA|nr:hypothetical protein L6452_07524 [Arctium lappa]